jgi:hypothetical protein
MKARPGTAARGRPRTPANTRLVQALIDRQDAMSRRTLRKIREILDTHVSVAGCAILWRRIYREAHERLGVIPERFLARRPDVADAKTVHRILTKEIKEALSELAACDDGGSLPADFPLKEQAPAVQRSCTLPEARAQCAELNSYLMNLKARIVRPRGPGTMIAQEEE